MAQTNLNWSNFNPGYLLSCSNAGKLYSSVVSIGGDIPNNPIHNVQVCKWNDLASGLIPLPVSIGNTLSGNAGGICGQGHHLFLGINPDDTTKPSTVHSLTLSQPNQNWATVATSSPNCQILKLLTCTQGIIAITNAGVYSVAGGNFTPIGSNWGSGTPSDACLLVGPGMNQYLCVLNSSGLNYQISYIEVSSGFTGAWTSYTLPPNSNPTTMCAGLNHFVYFDNIQQPNTTIQRMNILTGAIDPNYSVVVASSTFDFLCYHNHNLFCSVVTDSTTPSTTIYESTSGASPIAKGTLSMAANQSITFTDTNGIHWIVISGFGGNLSVSQI